MTDLPASPTPNRAQSSILGWLLLAAGMALLLLWANFFRGPEGGGSFARQKGVGEKFAGWQLQPLTGDSQPLSAGDTQGHVVLLNFWGTWCPPCRDEFPHIEDLARRFSKNPDFILAAVSCGGGDSDLEPLRAETTQFLEKARSDLPTYADQNFIARQKLTDLIGFSGYPTTILLDPQGIVRAVWVGYEPGTERQMERLIDKWLNHPVTAPGA